VSVFDTDDSLVFVFEVFKSSEIVTVCEFSFEVPKVIPRRR
jgi:hypothetical protein